MQFVMYKNFSEDHSATLYCGYNTRSSQIKTRGIKPGKSLRKKRQQDTTRIMHLCTFFG